MLSKICKNIKVIFNVHGFLKQFFSGEDAWPAASFAVNQNSIDVRWSNASDSTSTEKTFFGD